MLRIENVTKAYTPAMPVVKNVTLAVQEGEIVCLLGPSGCGKTTLLRMVAGLEQPDQGLITLSGQDLNSVPVHQRNFGLMFQEFALFPHRTVAENVAFGLRMAHQSHAQIRARVQEVLALVNLEGYDTRSIFALSGGERQRVALARSLAPNPRLLMLDEPLGSLDRALREELMVGLRLILKAVGVTALYVTHDQQEAFAVADRLVVMRRGEIEQIGTAQAIYHTPANRFVARFLGFQNLLPFQSAGEGFAHQLIAGRHAVPLHLAGATSSSEPYLLIRPDAVRSLGCAPLPVTTTTADEILVTGVVQALVFRGSYYQLIVSSVGEETHLRFDVPSQLMHAVPDGVNAACLHIGRTLWLQLDPTALAIIT